MAFAKRTVKDRAVQYPKRYKFVAVSGQADTYDLVPITGTVTEAGTAINKAYLQPIEDNLSGINDGTISVPQAINSDTLDNLQSSDFVKKLTITDEIADNGAYPENYIADISTNITRGNMPAGWYHVIYGRHMNTNGYGFQLWNAFGSNDLWIRSALGMSWTLPKKVSEPTSHASSDGTYGFGSELKYGHVALINSLNNSVYQDGFALSGYMGYLLNQLKQDKYTLVRTMSGDLSQNFTTQIPESDLNNYDEILFVVRLANVNCVSTYSSAQRIDVGLSLDGANSNYYITSLIVNSANPISNLNISKYATAQIQGDAHNNTTPSITVAKVISFSSTSVTFTKYMYFNHYHRTDLINVTGMAYLDIYGRKIK